LLLFHPFFLFSVEFTIQTIIRSSEKKNLTDELKKSFLFVLLKSSLFCQIKNIIQMVKVFKSKKNKCISCLLDFFFSILPGPYSIEKNQAIPVRKVQKFFLKLKPN